AFCPSEGHFAPNFPVKISTPSPHGFRDLLRTFGVSWALEALATERRVDDVGLDAGRHVLGPVRHERRMARPPAPGLVAPAWGPRSRPERGGVAPPAPPAGRQRRQG